MPEWKPALIAAKLNKTALVTGNLSRVGFMIATLVGQPKESSSEKLMPLVVQWEGCGLSNSNEDVKPVKRTGCLGFKSSNRQV